jgi:hypothetical protein
LSRKQYRSRRKTRRRIRRDAATGTRAGLGRGRRGEFRALRNVSSLVPLDDLSSAVALNGVVMNSARVVGPAVAGILIVTEGTTPCFAVNALSYLAVIGAPLAIRPLRAGKPRHSAGGVHEGVLDHTAAALRAHLPRPDHGAVDVRLHGHDADRHWSRR